MIMTILMIARTTKCRCQLGANSPMGKLKDDSYSGPSQKSQFLIADKKSLSEHYAEHISTAFLQEVFDG